MQNLAALLVKTFDNELDRYWAWITATTYPDLVVNKSYSIHDLHQAQQGATAVKAAKWNAIEDAKESRKRVRKAKDAEIAKKEASMCQAVQLLHNCLKIQLNCNKSALRTRPFSKLALHTMACITDHVNAHTVGMHKTIRLFFILYLLISYGMKLACLLLVPLLTAGQELKAGRLARSMLS
ncbi:hypothetical protein HDU79_000984 [Rhizoclosmatium sp. JEL0117]|nr:hypothetical protein HDU79_000984 [Rhizoclosmatium sp. JEL0117]